jgi:hypothetical protein
MGIKITLKRYFLTIREKEQEGENIKIKRVKR